MGDAEYPRNRLKPALPTLEAPEGIFTARIPSSSRQPVLDFLTWLGEKKERLIFERLRGLRASEEERLQLARSLAASPAERWARHQNFLRSLGLSRRSKAKGFGT